MVSDRNDWGLLDVLDSFASGERAAHVWAGAAGLATIIRREARVPYGRQRLEQTLSSTRREELAALLRHACYRAMNILSERGCVYTSRFADGRPYTSDVLDWDLRERALFAEPRMAEDPHRAMLAAARAVGWRGEHSTQELAVAALRITDDPQTSIYLANAEVLSDAPERALVVTDRLLKGGATDEIRAQAFLARGYALAELGRSWDALAAYKRAAEFESYCSASEFYRLVMAVWVASRSETVEAALCLRDVVQSQGDVTDLLDEWDSAYSDLERGPNRWAWASECRLEETTPEEAWPVIRAVLGSER